MFAYLTFHYCVMDGAAVMSYLILVLWLALVMSTLLQHC
jgi:hypothetical protein